MTENRDIEELLHWAFRDQQVERYVQALRGGAVGPSASLESGIGQILMLGTRVDSSTPGAKWLGARCHDDALTIYEAVMALPAEAWVEVIKYARSAQRPHCYDDEDALAGQWVVPRDKWGNPKRLWRDPVHQRGDLGEAPPVLIGIDPIVVEEARATYRLWHTALCELVTLVNRDLVQYRATWPAISPEPWLDRQVAAMQAG